MVSTRTADYLDKNTSAAIGGDNDGGGSRRGMARRLVRLLPGEDKEEAVIVASIDYTASFTFNFDSNDNDGNDGNDNDGNNGNNGNGNEGNNDNGVDGNNGNGVGAGGGEPQGTNKEEQEDFPGLGRNSEQVVDGDHSSSKSGGLS